MSKVIRKGVLVVAFGLATLTSAKAQNHQSKNPGIHAIEQIDYSKPWARSTDYIREYQYLDQQAQLDYQRARENYQAQMIRLKERGGNRTLQSTIRILTSKNRKQAGHREAGRVLGGASQDRSARANIERSYVNSQISIEKRYVSSVRSLDLKYQRLYEREGNSVSRDKGTITYEAARQKLYQNYVSKCIKDGKLPMEKDEYLGRLERQQRPTTNSY